MLGTVLHKLDERAHAGLHKQWAKGLKISRPLKKVGLEDELIRDAIDSGDGRARSRALI